MTRRILHSKKNPSKIVPPAFYWTHPRFRGRIGEMNPTLKTLLKAAAAVVIPGGLVVLIVSEMLKDAERREFKKYLRATYGEGSRYVDTYRF